MFNQQQNLVGGSLTQKKIGCESLGAQLTFWHLLTSQLVQVLDISLTPILLDPGCCFLAKC